MESSNNSKIYPTPPVVDLRNKVSKTKQIFDELQRISSSSSLRYSRIPSGRLNETERWATPRASERLNSTLPPRKSMFTPSRLQEFSKQLDKEANKPYWRCPRPSADRLLLSKSKHAPQLKTVDGSDDRPCSSKDTMATQQSEQQRRIGGRSGAVTNVFSIDDDDLQTDSTFGAVAQELSKAPPLVLPNMLEPGFLLEGQKKSVEAPEQQMHQPATSKAQEFPVLFTFTAPVTRAPVRPVVVSPIVLIDKCVEAKPATPPPPPVQLKPLALDKSVQVEMELPQQQQPVLAKPQPALFESTQTASEPKPPVIAQQEPQQQQQNSFNGFSLPKDMPKTVPPFLFGNMKSEGETPKPATAAAPINGLSSVFNVNGGSTGLSLAPPVVNGLNSSAAASTTSTSTTTTTTASTTNTPFVFGSGKPSFGSKPAEAGATPFVFGTTLKPFGSVSSASTFPAFETNGGADGAANKGGFVFNSTPSTEPAAKQFEWSAPNTFQVGSNPFNSQSNNNIFAASDPNNATNNTSTTANSTSNTGSSTMAARRMLAARRRQRPR
jgi:hypothetical protein